VACATVTSTTATVRRGDRAAGHRSCTKRDRSGERDKFVAHEFSPLCDPFGHSYVNNFQLD